MTFPLTSQTVINDSLVCVPKKYLIEAIKDIEKGDECKQELYLVKSNDSILYEQIQLRDSIINNYNLKEDNYIEIIENKDKQLFLNDEKINSIEKDIKKYKIQRNITIASSLIFISILIIL